MSITLSALQQQRRDTAANWTSANPTLLAGELGYETDTGKWKVGDGSTAWTALGYTPWSQISYPIVNANVAANAEIAVSKLANGTANQVLVTDGTDVSWSDNLTVAGNLTVNGTTTTVNSTTLTVDDKNIELGSVAAGSFTGDITAGSANITNVSSTVNLIPGVAVAISSGGGSVTLPASTVSSISGTTVTLNNAFTGSGSATGATLSAGGPTDVSADTGGITLKGTTDKTINWIDSTDAWTFSEHVNIANGKEYRINGTSVLTGTTLGSNVTTSSLTTVGTISTGIWSASTIAVNRGGTGQTTYADGELLIGNSTGNTLAKANLTGSSPVSITNGSGSISISVSAASTSAAGVVQLNSTTTSTSTSEAATASAVKAVKDGALATGGGSLTGDLTLTNQADLRFGEATANGSNFVAFQAPADVGSNVTWTLPATDASSSGQALVSDASGTLSFASIGGGATGGGSDAWALEHDNTITTSYSISSGRNVISAGPLTQNSGATITVPAGTIWRVI